MFQLKRFFCCQGALSALFVFSLIACGRYQRETSLVTLTFPAMKESHPENSLFNILSGTNTGPASLTSFNCLMVNVMGEGLGDWASESVLVNKDLGCGYLLPGAGHSACF